jgi:flagellar biosynthetic protein FlhB
MAESSGDKTEAPTPRRQQEARDEGNVPKSTDLTAACALLASIVLLDLLGFKIITGMKTMTEGMLSDTLTANSTRADNLTVLGAYAGRLTLQAVAPLALGITAVALLATVSQVGLVFSAKPLELNLTKLSPIQGAKRLFDARAGMRLVMSLGKIAVIVAVASVIIFYDMPRILQMAELEPLVLFSSACELVYQLALKLALLLLVLALLDYAFQRWKHLQDLKMSKQEVKEELKRMEGDPLMKQRRSRVARQLALQRIGQSVPQADVVVTNPTHFAVALRYDSKAMTAPRVVAKGADFMAMRIRQIAAANDVPMVEKKELARALYRTVEVGQEVPPQFYSAVAEILAYVYRVSGRKSA